MRRRTPFSVLPPRALVVALALGLWGTAARAQAPADPGRALRAEGRVSVRYGVSLRDGRQQDGGPGLSYGGLTPNDLAVEGAWFPHENLGLAGGIQREGFSLLDGETRVTGGALLRFFAGPQGRLVVGPVRLGLRTGYQWAQVAAFDSTVTPRLVPAARHGALLGGSVAVALPFGIVVQARGEAPIALATSLNGAGAQSTGFAADARVSFPVYRAGTRELRLVLDYQYLQDEVKVGEVRSAQALSRVGAAIEFSLLPPGAAPSPVRVAPPAPKPVEVEAPPQVGGLRVRVLKEGGAPVPLATVTVGGESSTTGPDGVALFEGRPLGPVAVKVAKEGFRPGEEAAQIVAGVTSELEVTLVEVAQRVPATLSGTIRSIRGGAPVRATLEIPELKLEVRADEQGTFRISVPGGSFRVIISAPGYRKQTKRVTVKEGDQTIFNVDLHPRR